MRTPICASDLSVTLRCKYCFPQHPDLVVTIDSTLMLRRALVRRPDAGASTDSVGCTSGNGVGSGGASPEPCDIVSTHRWPVDDTELYSRLMNPLLATDRYLERVIHCDFLPLWGAVNECVFVIEQLVGGPPNRLARYMAWVYGKAARPQRWSVTVDTTLRILMRPSRLRPSE